MVAGGGEMNRATCSLVSAANSAGASFGPQLAERHGIAGEDREPAPPVVDDGGRCLPGRKRPRDVQVRLIRHVFH